MLVVLLIFFTFWAENTDCASIFEALKTILFRNDSTELDDDAMSRIQQIGGLPQTSGNKTDEEEEKQWLSNKGQFVMRMPPWTKSNSSAPVFNRSMDWQVASSDFGGLDYDLEESFERMVTPPTSPDPWATGTLRSPRTGEDDDLDLAPTNPMQPEPPQITAAVDTFFIAKTAKPLFTRKIYKTTTKLPPTKNYIKFTKSASGHIWGRVTRRGTQTTKETTTYFASWNKNDGTAFPDETHNWSSTNTNLDVVDEEEATTATRVHWRRKIYTRQFRVFHKATTSTEVNVYGAEIVPVN